MQQFGFFDTRCALAMLALMIAPGSAIAYIDPGSGAYMVQVIFMVVAAALFYLRHPVRSLQTLWRWISSRGEQAPSQSQIPTADSDNLLVAEDTGQEKVRSKET
jgi:hypothetical protein